MTNKLLKKTVNATAILIIDLDCENFNALVVFYFSEFEKRLGFWVIFDLGLIINIVSTCAVKTT